MYAIDCRWKVASARESDFEHAIELRNQMREFVELVDGLHGANVDKRSCSKLCTSIC